MCLKKQILPLCHFPLKFTKNSMIKNLFSKKNHEGLSMKKIIIIIYLLIFIVFASVIFWAYQEFYLDLFLNMKNFQKKLVSETMINVQTVKKSAFEQEITNLKTKMEGCKNETPATTTIP